MSYADYEHCIACDGKTIYMGDGEAPDGIVTLHRACLDERVAAAIGVERERIYALLGNDHFVIFTADGWTTEHSVDCRLSGHMHECELHTAVGRVVGYGAPMAGRWRIDGIDSEGLPSLVRAERDET